MPNATEWMCQNGRVLMIIADNGKGFDSSVVRKGNGLANMEHRASQIHGLLTIESGSREGTTVTLSFRA